MSVCVSKTAWHAQGGERPRVRGCAFVQPSRYEPRLRCPLGVGHEVVNQVVSDVRGRGRHIACARTRLAAFVARRLQRHASSARLQGKARGAPIRAARSPVIMPVHVTTTNLASVWPVYPYTFRFWGRWP